MTIPVADPHFFDCPSCKAFATLRRVARKVRRPPADEYECRECHGRFRPEQLEAESAKRKVIE